MPEDRESQIAALPLRRKKGDRVEVLLVTSRDTGRWVMPKGWPMDGKKPWRAAEIEALEEAGVTGEMLKSEIGHYYYDKALSDGTALPVEVALYPLRVDRLRKRWKERNQRKRHWFSPKGAAKAVNEESLSALLMELHKWGTEHRSVRKLLK